MPKLCPRCHSRGCFGICRLRSQSSLKSQIANVLISNVHQLSLASFLVTTMHQNGMIVLVLSLSTLNAFAELLPVERCEQPPIDCGGLIAETCRIYCRECYRCKPDSSEEACIACAKRRCDECGPYSVCTTSSTTETVRTTTTGCPASNFVVHGDCTNRLLCKKNRIDTGSNEGDCTCFSENMVS
jgi:hypothetical protein